MTIEGTCFKDPTRVCDCPLKNAAQQSDQLLGHTNARGKQLGNRLRSSDTQIRSDAEGEVARIRSAKGNFLRAKYPGYPDIADSNCNN